MNKLFEYNIHIGRWRVLVQDRDIQSGAVKQRHIADKAVCPKHLSDEIKPFLTEELYNMVESLQVGGVALSNFLGNRQDIGITQFALSEMIRRIWRAIGGITGIDYLTFNMTIVPSNTIVYAGTVVRVTADSANSISFFNSIKIYANDVLIKSAENVNVCYIDYTITENTTFRCVGVMAGETHEKEMNVYKEVPFFIGSGNVYTDIMNEECRRSLDGTLEGSYDLNVNTNGDYIFIIIPASRKSEFRRADMNGYEIPMEAPVDVDDFVVYKSINTYNAGTYNIDIDINS